MNRKPSLSNQLLRIAVIYALIVAMTPAQMSLADSRFATFLGGAYPFSVGPTHKWMSGQYGVIGGFNFKEETWPIGLQFEGMTYRFGFNDNAIARTGSDGYMQITAGTANITWMPKKYEEKSIKPRLIVGTGVYNRVIHTTEVRSGSGTCWDPWFGYYSCNGTDNVSTGSTSQTKMGVNVGGSVGFMLSSGYELFVEARYHQIFTSKEDTQFVPLNVGIRW